MKATDILLLTALFLPTWVCAQDTCQDKKIDAEFNHSNPTATFIPIKKANGGTISICIKNTLPDKFTYEVAGLPLALKPGVSRAAPSGPPEVSNRLVTQVHNEKYGGYRVSIKSINGTPQSAVLEGQAVILSDAEFIVGVDTAEWDLELSGGFTISTLTNPAYGIETRTTGTGPDSTDESFVFRNEGAEDDVSLGFAGFITVFNHKWPHLGPTFGLGINQGTSNPTFYTGGTFRFGDALGLTLGAVWGSVARLPADVRIDQPVADPANVLNDLNTRIDTGFFVAFSYRFLSPGPSIFEKPIKGDSADKQE